MSDIERLAGHTARAELIDLLKIGKEGMQPGDFAKLIARPPDQIRQLQKEIKSMQARGLSSADAGKLLQLDPAQVSAIRLGTQVQMVPPETLAFIAQASPALRQLMGRLVAEEAARYDTGYKSDLKPALEKLVALESFVHTKLITEQRAVAIARGAHASDLFTPEILAHQAKLSPETRVKPETLEKLFEMGAQGDVTPLAMEAYKRALSEGRINESSLAQMLGDTKAARLAKEAEMMHAGDVSQIFPDMFPPEGKFGLGANPGADAHRGVHETRRFMDALEKGELAVASKIVESSPHRANSVEIFKQKVKIKLEELHDPAALATAKAQMLDLKNARYFENHDQVGNDMRGKVQTPEVIVNMPDGSSFRLGDSAKIADGFGKERSTTPQEKAFIESVQQSTAGKALLGKEAMIFWEERLVHANQKPDSDGALSKLRHDFKQSEQYKKMKSEMQPHDLAEAMREIDVAGALIESGMTLPAVQRLLDNQHHKVRQPFYDWVGKHVSAR